MDPKQAARDYPRRISPDGYHYLLTKPFCANPWGDEFSSKLHDLAFIVEVLALPMGSAILEIGCGPGWLPMYLALAGYRAAGVDVAPEMIRIARRRARAVKFRPRRKQRRLEVSFAVGDAEEFDLGCQFDGVVIYDSLHHFEHPEAVVARAFEHLRPGGRVLIKDPPEEHAASPAARQESERYGVLEQGFSAEFIRGLLERAGFMAIRNLRLAPVIADRHAPADYVNMVIEKASSAHAFLAARPGPGALDSLAPGVLRAELAVAGLPAAAAPGAPLAFTVEAVNSGDTVWRPLWRPEGGYVRLGVALMRPDGTAVEDYAKAFLPGWVGPGEKAVFHVELAAPGEPGRYRLRLDLASELVAWFSGRGGHPPPEFELDVRP